MHYLASPYSSPDPLVRKTRFLLVQQACAALISRGLHVWSPIVHSHDMAQRFDLPTDAGFWHEYNYDFIRRCDGLFVLAIEGWRASKGVAEELAIAQELVLPVRWIDAEGGDMLPNQQYDITTDTFCTAKGA